ncbi:MAG: hypothetical protein UX02_C0003G0101 [Candidatus Moranbacteria bacterium GW2011_GWC1_45_18]|nr:MAG: hypothetical protein UT79_C0004G0102 [Candidatus Moranbacteria bacterium GW2011_GWC2_40_12]KKT32166.1 MAG: hypothetical protein UW19_C0030G0007 [Candidatus Moranbacteria bacterium GW2011_GWF2_44_10]KKT71363.1 MAG: hypothetical protein UW66_C0035G0005 [Candidatus Moranbacteria bacterium GW2011_GWF1_44_4]KKT99558.1 MAG: hypothetical protein UX02_C0003G0101 [Candidatus Moranbacteria bacterium GW2011_GWC1_45_18]
MFNNDKGGRVMAEIEYYCVHNCGMRVGGPGEVCQSCSGRHGVAPPLKPSSLPNPQSAYPYDLFR